MKDRQVFGTEKGNTKNINKCLQIGWKCILLLGIEQLLKTIFIPDRF